MTKMNGDFRLGIVDQKILFDFRFWLLDQLEKADWIQEINSGIQSCPVGKGRQELMY